MATLVRTQTSTHTGVCGVCDVCDDDSAADALVILMFHKAHDVGLFMGWCEWRRMMCML